MTSPADVVRIEAALAGDNGITEQQRAENAATQADLARRVSMRVLFGNPGKTEGGQR